MPKRHPSDHALDSVNERERDDAPRSITGQVVKRLRQDILSGELPPGAHLSIKDLSQRFAVSLSPMREAMTRLDGQGLLQSDEQRGFWVAPVSIADLDEVMRLRIELERMALAASITHGDIAWESRVIATLYRMNRIDRVHGDTPSNAAWERAHGEFHLALVAACRMPLLLQFLARLHGLSDRYRRIFLATAPPDARTSAEHKQIAEAAVGRNTADATMLLTQHIERTGRAVRAHLELP